MGEHHPNHDVEDAKSGTLDNNFDSGEETRDESDPDYDPSRDHYIDLGADFSIRLHFELQMYIVRLVG